MENIRKVLSVLSLVSWSFHGYFMDAAKLSQAPAQAQLAGFS